MDGWIWAAIGTALIAVEVVAPGYFLAFPAAGALATFLAALGGVAGLEAQLAIFALASCLLFAVAFRAYRNPALRRVPVLVNSPARLVGTDGMVEDAITGGRGKVRVGDSVWLARGPDLPAGTPVRVAAIDGTVLEVEPRV